MHDLVLVKFSFVGFFESYFDAIICVNSTEPKGGVYFNIS